MNTYFRAQTKGISFEDMKHYNSADGGDGNEMGLCACLSVSELLRNTVMDAMDNNDEVVIFKATGAYEIYDGYRVAPQEEICRMTVREFIDNADDIADKYESW